MRILDLFAGAGGAAMGYHRAFPDAEIVGVDIAPQPRYPFTFVQADAMEYPLDGFDFIHASPPCQAYSRLRHLPWLRDKDYPMLIDGTRERLTATPGPWVMENIEDAPLDPSVVLCGTMFGLPLYRHRRFESSVLVLAPAHQRHQHVIYAGRKLGSRYSANSGGVVGVYGHQAGPGIDAVKAVMGIDWMNRHELTQAIPPAYTEWIGHQLAPLFEVAA